MEETTQPIEPESELTEEVEQPAPAPASEPEPDHEVTDPGFRVDDWDLKPESLPERIRPVAERLTSHYSEEIGRLSKQLEENRELHELYREIVEGKEDPRLKEYVSAKEELEASLKAIEEERDQYRTNLERLTSEVQKREDERIQKEFEAYQREHAWMFDDGPMQDQALKLLDEGWQTDTLPDVLKLPKEELAFARQKMKENPSAQKEIVELAKLRSKKRRPSSANLVGGAETPTITSPTPNEEVSAEPSGSLSEQAVQRALRKHSSRTRRR